MLAARGWRTARRTTTGRPERRRLNAAADARGGEPAGPAAPPSAACRQSWGSSAPSVVAASAIPTAAWRARSSAARSGSPAAGGSPRRTGRRAAPRVSMPSATTRRPSSRAACTALSTIARASWLRSAATVARSICSSRTGWCDSATSPASPAAKSSIDTSTPRLAQALEGAARGLGVLHRRGLRQLAQQAPRPARCATSGRARGGGRNRPGELHAGDVHRHAQRRPARLRGGLAQRRRAPNRRWSRSARGARPPG